MRLVRTLAALVLLAAIAPGGLHVQADELMGEEVRVWLSDPAREADADVTLMLRGTVLRLAPDSLVLRLHPAAGPTAVVRAGVDRLELLLGARSRRAGAWRQAWRWSLFGAVEFALLDAANDHPIADEPWQSMLIGAGVGAAMGAVYGALFPGERWRRIEDW